MTVTFPPFRVGDPVRHKALSVFPLFGELRGDVEYRLADEAIADGSVVVQEVDEGGSVPELLVENKGTVRVLFLEGEELVGAKQNRILNTSVLIAAGSRVKIPVSCVEQGRWAYRSRHFASSGSSSSAKLRYSLKKSVSDSALAGAGHKSNQGEVWGHVGSMLGSLGIHSKTVAMSDAYDSLEDRIAAYRDGIAFVDGACGLAVAIGRNVVSLDLFDKPETCRKAWGRLLSGCILDALEAESTEELAEPADAERLLQWATAATWESVKAVGEGEEYRAETRGDHASVLSFGDAVVHGSVMAAV